MHTNRTVSSSRVVESYAHAFWCTLCVWLFSYGRGLYTPTFTEGTIDQSAFEMKCGGVSHRDWVSFPQDKTRHQDIFQARSLFSIDARQPDCPCSLFHLKTCRPEETQAHSSPTPFGPYTSM